MPANSESITMEQVEERDFDRERVGAFLFAPLIESLNIHNTSKFLAYLVVKRSWQLVASSHFLL